MKVPAEKLAAKLSSSILPIYIISGDEPLLVQESCDLVRDFLRQQGYSGRELFHVEAGFDWQQVLFHANSMSLFSDKKLLELRLPTGKPGDKGARVLQSYIDNPHDGNTMLLVLPKLDASSQRSKWFKTLEAAGLFVPIWPIDVARLPAWINERFRRVGLDASRDAVMALCERIEGNLLAAVQEIERLGLIAPGNRVDLDLIVSGVTDNARYDVFGLIDAAVGQDPLRSARMVQGLRAESSEILVITAMLARELRSLVSMAQSLNDGQNVTSVLQHNRVWAKRKSAVGKCLRSQNVGSLRTCLRRLGKIDRQIKGIGKGDPWDELESLLLNLAGIDNL